MDSITIYPKDEKLKSLLKSLSEKMKVRFEITKYDEETSLSESELIAKIDKSILQADSGKTKKLTIDQQKKFLGL